MKERTYRRGTLDDVDFLVPAIIAAERSGGPRSLYERLFDLDEAELAAILRAILAEELPGSELCCDSFWIALEEGEPAGCIATWIEGTGGAASAFARAALLSHAVGPERWKNAAERMRVLSLVEVPRAAGALQIEAVYVAPGHRGSGVAAALIEHGIEAVQREAPGTERAQILSVVGNSSSARAFEKAGFRVTRRAESDDPRVGALFPGGGRLLWERSLPRL
jgi:ribosomal protein S18 acetylase RimI-like enzyme